jgi:hypothetical protein
VRTLAARDERENPANTALQRETPAVKPALVDPLPLGRVSGERSMAPQVNRYANIDLRMRPRTQLVLRR